MNQKSKTVIGPETVLARSDEVLEAEIDGEKVMMSIEKGEYYGLDATGSEIWQLFEQPRSVAEICDQMIARYDVEPEECERDVVAFLDDLVSDGTLRVEPGQNSPIA